MREAMLDVVQEPFAGEVRQGPELVFEAELLAVLSDEVEHCEHCFVLAPAKTSAELLEEQGCTGGGAQEEQGVYVGDVESLIEEVHGEDHLQGAGLEVSEGLSTLFGRSLAGEGHGVQTGGTEVLGHEVGMRDRDAEAQRPHGAGLDELLLHGLHDESRPRVIAGQDVAQGGVVIGAALPLHCTQVGVVADSEVVERAEELVLQGLPQAHLGSDAPAEELVLDVPTVHALRRRGQSQ
ncbi:hypothetical protein SO3561_07573 [Streptomyces olivochromogenes]|uniref:Uncharacterized protein n=1 Tax=Streptomyces olivochromogenes TaxID=1963 RepID=A0A250VPJ2_STROL|nr:hypothetical protein SO3561_07573 [Streptomyces olivochromogenes]